MNMEKNNAPLLEMRNIKKGFFGNQVLTDINFTLKEGEVLGLVGENGAGKSTLMKILFGMDVIRETGGYEGDVLIDGEKCSSTSPFDALKAGIGMVHQEFSLIPGFTATENILLNREPKKKSVISEVFGPRLDTLDYKEMDNRAAKAIEKMGVAIDQKMVISSMPVGHKQFTEIARELSKENLKLLILDEPTAVLTEQEAQALLDSIRGMASRGIAVIFITHRLQEILSVCDKVVIMAGWLRCQGRGRPRDGCPRHHPLHGGARGGCRRRRPRYPRPLRCPHHSVHPQAVGGYARRDRPQRGSGREGGRDPGHRRSGRPGQAGSFPTV